MTNQLKIYKNPVTSIEIASKPHELATKLASFAGKDPIAKAICSDIPIRSYEEDALKKNSLLLITKLFASVGQKPKEEDVLFLATELIRELVISYKFLTMREIRLAFEDGIRRKYGDFYGVNPSTCLQFIEGYLEIRKARTNKMLKQKDIEANEQRVTKYLKYLKNKKTSDLIAQVGRG